MSHPLPIQFQATALETLATATGRIAVLAEPDQTPSPAFRRLDRLTRGALGRALASEAFGKIKSGDAMELAFPAGLAAETLLIVRLGKKADIALARKAGATIGKSHGAGASLVLAEGHPRLWSGNAGL